MLLSASYSRIYLCLTAEKRIRVFRLYVRHANCRDWIQTIFPNTVQSIDAPAWWHWNCFVAKIIPIVRVVDCPLWSRTIYLFGTLLRQRNVICRRKKCSKEITPFGHKHARRPRVRDVSTPGVGLTSHHISTRTPEVSYARRLPRHDAYVFANNFFFLRAKWRVLPYERLMVDNSALMLQPCTRSRMDQSRQHV